MSPKELPVEDKTIWQGTLSVATNKDYLRPSFN
jgi:hypothetical protein